MQIIQTSYSVSDYCRAIERGEIAVNSKYQRSHKVWPPAARSFLIETILLGYPVPKLSLYQVTDVRTRQSYKEIVDGQQRSNAIVDFFKNELRLSRTLDLEEARGRLYSELDENLQQRFLEYALAADLFVAATPDEIRETFRRINSYTVPLNAEEQRHAIHQGAFKWFVYRLSRDFDQNFIELGTFGESQLVRMADAKLLSEIVHGMLYGITTTNKNVLDRLYKEYDNEFDEQSALEGRLRESMNHLLAFRSIHQSQISRPYHLYSLILAITHMHNPISTLEELVQPPADYRLSQDIVETNLSKLAEVLEAHETPLQVEYKEYRLFIEASSKGTNVRDNRETRFEWYCRALLPDLI